MLLSMFISFILARKFTGKTYVSLMTVLLILVSLFSMGLPRLLPYYQYQSTYELKYPLPLSFPFYASLQPVTVTGRPPPPIGLYLLHFLTFEFVRVYAPFTLGWLCLYYSFFLLFNLVGAIFGYWISKTTFIDKLIEER
jgi:hypothetical protein